MHEQGLAAMIAAGGKTLRWDDPEVARACGAADLALDGIVGIGGTGALRQAVLPAVQFLRAARVPVIAVDIPSGVSADTGEVGGDAIRADITVTFGVAKPGLLLHPGMEHVGLLAVVDIGLRASDLHPAALMLSLGDLADGPLNLGGHKYTRGVVQVTAGSRDYPGAAHLAVRGARGSGVGMVALHCGTGAETGSVIAAHPDVVSSPAPLFGRADARVLGPGLDQQSAMGLALTQMADPAPLVVDASGLGVLATAEGRAALARRAASGHITVVTPHDGEFARLGQSRSGGRLEAARRAADELGAVVVLKGPGTVIAWPVGAHAFIDTFGGPQLGTAGSGDVLAGLCGGLLAGEARRSRTTLSLEDAARVCARAVGLHGLAGRLAAADRAAVTAPDIAAELPRALLAAQAANRP
jgi:hydroxyethylthiazole kinase-like uncharacterized protein yjeF